jgi:hypothetical protein
VNNPMNATDPTGNMFINDECGYQGLECKSKPGGIKPGDAGYCKRFSLVASCNKGKGNRGRIPTFLDPRRKKYDPGESSDQALEIVRNWFSQHGPAGNVFYADSSLTLDIINEPGMGDFRQNWEEAGYPLPYEWQHQADVREGSLLNRIISGVGVYASEHLWNLPLAVTGFGSTDPSGTVDAIGGTIGSLDYIRVYDAGNGNVLFEVENVTGWQSGTRIPGTNYSLINDISREDAMFGGTITELFYWMEPFPSQ